MADIAELKSVLADLIREKHVAVRTLKDLETQYSNIDPEISRIESQMDISISEAKENSRGIYISNISAPYQKRIAELKSTLSALSMQFSQQLSSIDEDKVYSQIKEKHYGNSNISQKSEMVRQLIAKDVGERFYLEYSEMLNNSSRDLTPSQLNAIISNINKDSTKLFKISTDLTPETAGKFGNFIDSFARSRLDTSNKSVLKSTAVGGIVVLALSFILAPLYVVLLSVKVTINVRRSLTLSRILKDYKLVQDNLEGIESALKDKAAKETDRIRIELENEKSASVSNLEKAIAEQDSLYQQAIQDARINFKFDEEPVRSRLSEPIERLMVNKERILREMSSCNENIESLSLRINSIREQILDETKGIRSKYLDFDRIPTQSDTLYSPEILIDFNEKNEPIYFNLDTSILFFYQDVEHPQNFMRLCSAQLRSRLAPGSLFVTLWDSEYMGVYLTQFSREVSTLFTIKHSEDDMKDSLDLLSEQLVRRMSIILTDYPEGGIQEYNKDMVELESVPEGYTFLFILNPVKTFLSDTKFLQLLNIGPSVGIFPVIFTQEDELTEDFLQVVKKTGRFHIFNRTSIDSYAKDRVLEALDKFGR